MKRVKVLKPFGSYAVGDTPTLFGAHARDLRSRGIVEWETDAPAPAAEPASSDETPAQPVATPPKAKPAKRPRK